MEVTQRIEALSVTQACAALNVSRSVLYGLFREGKVQPHKLGRKTVVFRHDVEQFLRSLPVVNLRRAA